MISFLRRRSIPQQIALGFMLVIFLGALLLTLPISSQSQSFTPFLDALFTATSAVAVTGQTTLNTAQHWSYFGKTVIITLIEIGGLGFVSVIVMVFVFMGKKLSLKQKLLLQEAINTDSLKDGKTIIAYVLKVSLSIQALGALVLSLDFIPRFGLLKGIYFSVFHSISAFNNAGFDLFGNSLLGFRENPLVILTIAFLIIFGGLGFLVWKDLLDYPQKRKLSLHSKLTLITTLSISLLAFALFAFSESRHGTFAELSLPYRFLNYFFLAISPRTAGYANIDYAKLSLLGIFLTLILMFIGASSGSTGGGIKVTTFATIILYIRAKFKDQPVHYGRRNIPQNKIDKSILIMFMGLGMIVLATFLLLISESIPEGFGLEYILVEVFSCFSTVGLTMGLTVHLTAFGKIVLIVLMFAGRIGLLTFFISLTTDKHERKPLINYPDENILVG